MYETVTAAGEGWGLAAQLCWSVPSPDAPLWSCIGSLQGQTDSTKHSATSLAWQARLELSEWLLWSLCLTAGFTPRGNLHFGFLSISPFSRSYHANGNGLSSLAGCKVSGNMVASEETSVCFGFFLCEIMYVTFPQWGWGTREDKWIPYSLQRCNCSSYYLRE